MNQTQANEAVRACVGECLAAVDRLDAMRTYLDGLESRGWAAGDRAQVRNASMRILATLNSQGA
jgi:hypothetical protein